MPLPLRATIYATLVSSASCLHKHLTPTTLETYTGQAMAVFVRFKWSSAEGTPASKTTGEAKEWARVGKSFKASKRVLIGDLDCSSHEGFGLCQHANKDEPTLMFWQPMEKRANIYGGEEKDFATLRSFALEHLGPPCSPKYRWRCDSAELSALEQLLELGLTNLTQTFEQGKAELLAAQATSTEALDEARARIEPGLKLVKRARDHLMSGADKKMEEDDGDDLWAVQEEAEAPLAKKKKGEAAASTTSTSSGAKQELR